MITAESHAYEPASSNEQASTLPCNANTVRGRPVNPSTHYQPLTTSTTEQENIYENPCDDVQATTKRGGRGKVGKPKVPLPVSR